MEARYVDFAEGNEGGEDGEVRGRLGGQAFLDITDRKVSYFFVVIFLLFVMWVVSVWADC